MDDGVRTIVHHREMGGADDRIQTVEIVGLHARFPQRPGEIGKNVRVVVHPGQEDALVEKPGARRGETGEGLGDLGVDFPRVVGVHDEHGPPRKRLDPGEKRGVDPGGQHDRKTRVQAKRAQAGEIRERLGPLAQAACGERERIAAAQDDFAEFRQRPQAREHRRVGSPRTGRVGEMAAETVAAVHRAESCGDDEGPRLVFGQDPFTAGKKGFPERIGNVARGRGGEFFDKREHLAEKGIGRISAADALKIGLGNEETEVVGRASGGLEPAFTVKAEAVEKFTRIADRPREDLPPRRAVLAVGGGLGVVRVCERGSRYHKRRPIIPGVVATAHAGTLPEGDVCVMGTYTTSEFKSGLKVLLDGEPCAIVENEFVKPGKGQAFNRVRLRNLRTGRTVERTFKSGDALEAADIVDVEMRYLYQDGTHWHFMHPETFEQYQADAVAMAGAEQWLKGEEVCVLTLWDNRPLAVTPPHTVVLRVVETDPGVRGDTSGGGGKPARLETGASVRVPLFVQEGELIKVNTRSGEYVARAKE